MGVDGFSDTQASASIYSNIPQRCRPETWALTYPDTVAANRAVDNLWRIPTGGQRRLTLSTGRLLGIPNLSRYTQGPACQMSRRCQSCGKPIRSCGMRGYRFISAFKRSAQSVSRLITPVRYATITSVL